MIDPKVAKHSLALVAAAALLLSAGPARARAVPEIEVVGLPDAAMTRMTPSGPVILYNPKLCKKAGVAREFFRAHEYGHVVLGHLQDPALAATPSGRAVAEAEADCYAAMHSSPRAIDAMVKLVLSQAPDGRDAVYGTKLQRSRRILACTATWSG